MPLFGIFCFGIPEFTTYFQISCGTSAYPGGVLFRSCLNHHNIGGQCCHLVNADENPFLYAQCRVMSVRLKFHLARLDSTRHIRRVEPMHFGCVELVEQHSSTRSTRRARLARLARHVELDWLDTSSSTGATCNLVMITVIHIV